MSVQVNVAAPEDLDPPAIRRIAAGASVHLDDALLASVAAHRDRVLAALATSGYPVYGVNTGMGRLADVALDAEQQAEHQSLLLTGRAVGGPPWLPVEDVRALLVIRLRGLLTEHSGAGAEAVRFLADRLNDGFTPAVPRTGIGCAGEIIPLSHAFQTFLGIGTVLDADREIPAAEALERRGVPPYRPGPKEGSTFLQGAPLATAHAIMRGDEAGRLVDIQLLAAAVTVDALGAPRGIYRPALAGTDDVLSRVLTEVHSLTEGGVSRPEVVQAPVSVRVGPQAIAYARRTLGEMAAAVDRLLSGPTDSPALVDGDFVSTAVFHAVEPGLRMDAVTTALVHLGEISVQRLQRMLDERFSGLPAQLAAEEAQAGLVPLHKRAVGELHALRRLATPAAIGSIDTSAGQEDVQAFACAAGEQLRTAIEHLFAISACELLGGWQAHTLRGDGAPALRDVYAAIGTVVPPILVDRPLGPDVTHLVQALRVGEIPVP